MIHIQNLTNDWPQALDPSVLGANFRPLVKAFSGDRLVTAKGVNPNCRTILRYHYTKRQHFGGDWEANKEKARVFFRCFIDGTFRKDYARYTDYIEEWNEYLAPSLTVQEMGDRIRWARAVARVWETEYRNDAAYAHIKLIMCNTAIGNDIPIEFANICRNYDCVMGYHAYTKWVKGVRDPGDFRWLSGRIFFMEKAWGIKLPIALTEVGPYQGPNTGWMSKECLGGDLDKYIKAMRLWIRDLAQTDAYQEGRLLGFTPFTTGPTPEWTSFRTDKTALIKLRDMYAVEWKPGTVPQPTPPPVPPPPEPEPLPAYATVVKGIGYLNLRAEPGILGADVGDLHPGGGPLEIIERDGDWYKVAGWAHGNYLLGVPEVE